MKANRDKIQVEDFPLKTERRILLVAIV